LGTSAGWRFWEIALENEKAWHTEAEIRGMWRGFERMQECVERGLATEGILPGGLND